MLVGWGANFHLQWKKPLEPHKIWILQNRVPPTPQQANRIRLADQALAGNPEDVNRIVEETYWASLGCVAAHTDLISLGAMEGNLGQGARHPRSRQ